MLDEVGEYGRCLAKRIVIVVVGKEPAKDPTIVPSHPPTRFLSIRMAISDENGIVPRKKGFLCPTTQTNHAIENLGRAVVPLAKCRCP